MNSAVLDRPAIDTDLDRRIRLVTGEVLDLSRPNLGRPDGLALWDRLSIGDGEFDRRVSSHESPSARCLFPLCEDTGTGLVLVNPKHGRRYARHFKGEGFKDDDGHTHAVAGADQSPIVYWLCERYAHAGYEVDLEHSFTVDGESWEQRRRSDYFVSPGPAAQPIAGEVQNARTNHRQRAADARTAGFTSLWTPKYGDSLGGVSQLRFTSSFDEVKAKRDPEGVRMAGFANLTWVDGKVVPELRALPMGTVAEELPAGEWVEFWATSNQVLLVPPAQAARFAAYERKGADDARSGPADGIVRRHRELLAQAAVARKAVLERPHPTIRRTQPAEIDYRQSGLPAAVLASYLPETAAPPPVKVQPGPVVLDWSHPRHWARDLKPCGLCKKPTQTRTRLGLSWHKTCAEWWLTKYPGAAM